MIRKNHTRPIIVILLITAAHYFHHQLTALVVPLLPFMRDGFGLSYTQAGALVSAFALSYGIAQLPAGWLADRVGPRYLLLMGISGVAVAGILVGLSQTFAALVIFLVVMGIAGGGYHPSATPIISMAVPPEQRGRAVGIHIMGGSTSHLVAPLLGVAIAGFLGWRGAFLVIAAPVFLLGLVVFFLFGRMSFAASASRAAVGAPGGAAGGAAVGMELGGDPEEKPGLHPATPIQIGLMVAMTSTVAALVASTIAFVPLFLVDALHVSEAQAALGLVIFFSAGFWAAPIGGAAADRLGPSAVFAVVVSLAGPLIILLAYSGSVMLAMVSLVLLGAVSFSRMAVSESFLVAAVPPARRSTVLGIYFFAGMEGSGVITPIVGNLIDRFGFRFAFTTTGVGAMVVLGSLALVAAWHARGTAARAGLSTVPATRYNPDDERYST